MSIRRGTSGDRRRVGRVLMWGALALGVVLSLVWIISGERMFKVNGPGGSWAGVSGGRVWVSFVSPPIPESSKTPTGVRPRRTPFAWWFDGAWRRGDAWVAVPLWVVVGGCVALSALGGSIERSRRRARARGLCHACGYDRSGFARAAVCPECGAGVAGA